MKINYAFIFLLTNIIFYNSANATPFTFDCKFPFYASMPSGNFKKNNIKTSIDQNFEIKILVNDNDAFAIGNQGTEKLVMIKHKMSGYTFLEFTPINTVQVTVIDAKLNAVHSRHTQLPDLDNNFTLLPSQYYGTCEIKN